MARIDAIDVEFAARIVPATDPRLAAIPVDGPASGMAVDVLGCEPTGGIGQGSRLHK